MTCIGWDREFDPELNDFYARNLLEPEWAGELDTAELAYIKSQLRQSPSLRRRWGFRPSAKRLSDAKIRAVAMNGIQRHARERFSFAPTGQAVQLDRRHRGEAER